jgi:hypothetical protein
MKSVAQLIDKLRKPPAVHNWVKHIRPRRDDTAFALHNFALNPPRTSLVATVTICIQIVVDGISLEQALRCADSIKDAASRERARWIIGAFHPFAIKHELRGLQVFRDMLEFYPVSAGVRVPVRPTFVLNEEGKLVPYFLICWAKMDLTGYQLSLLSTLISEAILTLEEFRGSDAVVICTPLAPYSKKERQVRTWNVSDFPILDETEKQAVFDRYAAALDDAERMLIESLS